MMKDQTPTHRYQRLMLAAVSCSALLAITVSATIVSTTNVSAANVSAAAVPLAAQVGRGHQESFRAAVFVDGEPAPERTASVDIVITRWTTPEARNDLLAALIVKGEQQMRVHLSRQRAAGYVQLATGPRYELKYAWHEPEGNLTRVVLLSDRIVPFLPAWNAIHTFQYRITSFELRVDGEGNGSGAAQVGVRVHVPPETMKLMVETLDAKPVELREVSRVQ